ncbi:TPA: hypothetical protein QIC04_001928 [Morganella morganii subsp. morganii]|nr:hypothetical protein [Morganella morganii subsp. morganii]
MICPECCGDGKETCTNPDHGFIQALGFHDIGRIGCPCCGHDEFHKMKSGCKCEICNGTGAVTDDEFIQYCNESDLSVDEHTKQVAEIYSKFISLGIIKQ